MQTKTLIIMRHAQAESQEGLRDFEYPLGPAGKRDAAAIGHCLVRLGIIPDAVLSSSAHRARTTAEIVATQCGCRCEIQLCDDFYSGNESTIMDAIKGLPDETSTALIVGHNPILEMLIAYLVSNQGCTIRLTPGTMAMLSVQSGSWHRTSRNCAVLEMLVRPEAVDER